jgi:hypothetical protein
MVSATGAEASPGRRFLGVAGPCPTLTRETSDLTAKFALLIPAVAGPRAVEGVQRHCEVGTKAEAGMVKSELRKRPGFTAKHGLGARRPTGFLVD